MADIGTDVVPEGVGGLRQGTVWRSRAGAQVLDWVHAPSRLEQSPPGEAPGRPWYLHREGLYQRLRAHGNDAGRMGVRASVRAAHCAQGIGADSAFWAVGSPRPRRAAGVLAGLSARPRGL